MDAKQLYGYSMFYICLFGAIAISAVWLKLVSKEEEEAVIDYGFFWFSCALMTLSLASFWNLNKGLISLRYGGDFFYCISTFFSSANNLFLLFAFKCFDKLPSFVDNLKEHKIFTYKNILIFTVVVFVSSTIIILFFYSIPLKQAYFLDICFSVLALFLVGVGLTFNLWDRGLTIFALLSGIIVSIAILSQVSRYIPIFGLTLRPVFILFSIPSFITMFLVLAVSWLTAKLNLPKAKDIHLSFTRIGVINLSIPGGFEDKEIKLQEREFGTLLKLAFRKINKHPWVNYEEERFHRNQMRLIAEQIFKSVYPEETSKTVYNEVVEWLKSSLFKNDNNKNRMLTVPIQNIKISFPTFCQENIEIKNSNLQVLINELILYYKANPQS